MVRVEFASAISLELEAQHHLEMYLEVAALSSLKNLPVLTKPWD